MTTRYAPESQRHWLLRFSTPAEITRRLVFLCTLILMIALGTNCFLGAYSWIDKPFAGFFMNRQLTVLSLGMPDWEGVKAGLQSADHILKIDGIEVTKVADLKKAVNNVGADNLLEYEVKRGEIFFSVKVPVTNFTVYDLLSTFGSAFVQGMIYLLIGCIVFILKPDSTISVLFFIASTLQGASSLVDFTVASSASPLSYLLIVCDITIPALILHFSALFPLRYNFIDRWPWLILIPYVISALILILMLSLYPGPLFYRTYFPLIYPYQYLAVFSFLGAITYSYFRRISSLARQ